MSDKELADYLNEDLETRYQIHKAAYFERYPDSNIEKFHRFETAYLKRQIQKYNTKEKIEPEETEIYLSQIEVLEYINSISSSKTPQQAETKTDKLKAELGKFGFFELQKVKQLSEPNQQNLFNQISTNDLPFVIAMFEYLGFIKHLKTEHFKTDRKLFKEVANWFKVTDRAVKGNIYVLNENSKENRTRYTAHQQKQIVQKNYEALK